MTFKLTYKLFKTLSLFAFIAFNTACNDEPPVIINNNNNDTTPIPVDFTKLTDTYYDTYSFDYYYKWGIHNVHDPIIRKFGDWWYCYSTDVGYGIDVRSGLQIRKSKNLIEWTFVGWVFDQLPPKGVAYIQKTGATPNNSLWAPSVIEHEGTYRLYYSLASNVGLKSCIGLATSTNPSFYFNEVDVVVGTDGTSTQTNGIDPSVIVTPDGEHWMTYGSSWDGIYIMQLNPANGLALKPGDRGKRIAHRGFTGSIMNGNIEGAEIIFNPDHGMYYLFIAYDWLSTKYNIRVGRSTNVQGPYVDIFGNNMYANTDNYPMIVAPYKFSSHSGWQGVSHCTVFSHNNKYYIAHQGRPGSNMYFMDLHVRELFWTPDGWPIASPQRYAGHKQYNIDNSGIAGKWEIINFKYNVVPGFDKEQTNPEFQNSSSYTLNANGTINSSGTNTWSFNYPWLKLNIDGITVETHVSVGRDWESVIDSTLVFTGIKPDGMAFWGKKIIE